MNRCVLLSITEKKYAHNFLNSRIISFYKELIILVICIGILYHVWEHEERNEHVTIRPGGVVVMCYKRYVR